VEKMDRKVSSISGAALYKKRQHMVDLVFGQTKDGRGARRFMRRGSTGRPKRVEAVEERSSVRRRPSASLRPDSNGHLARRRERGADVVASPNRNCPFGPIRLLAGCPTLSERSSVRGAYGAMSPVPISHQ